MILMFCMTLCSTLCRPHILIPTASLTNSAKVECVAHTTKRLIDTDLYLFHSVKYDGSRRSFYSLILHICVPANV